MNTDVLPGDLEADRVDEALAGKPDRDAADTSRIDETLADYPEPTASDPHIDALEARIRLLAPAHAHWASETGVPDDVVSGLIDRIREQVGHNVGVVVPDADQLPTRYQVAWTTPEGLWRIGWHRCICDGPDGPDDRFHWRANGPDTDVSRREISADDTVEILYALGILAR